MLHRRCCSALHALVYLANLRVTGSYVALSRARSLAGLHVLDMVSRRRCALAVFLLTRAPQDAATIRANPKVIEFYQRTRSDVMAMNAVVNNVVASAENESSGSPEESSSGVLDTLKGRWNSLMASVQSNIEETAHAAASLLPFTSQVVTPSKSSAPLPLSQRNQNVTSSDSPLKKQKTGTEKAVPEALQSGASQLQPAQQTSHACIGVAGEKLTWSGNGTLMSACNCMLMLKQVCALLSIF